MTWIDVVLYILLAVLALTLVVISAPIRFSIAVNYEKVERSRRKIAGEFWISYIHPALFIYRYSSCGQRERVKFFGFDRKKKKRADTGADVRKYDTVKINADTDVHQDSGMGVNVDTDVHQDNDMGVNIDTGVHKDNDTGINVDTDVRQDNGTPPLWARAAERIKRVKDEPHLAKAIDDIREIGSSGTYKFLMNAALRKKIFRWLLRSFKHTFKSARLDELKVRARVGFKNPVKVGKVYGYFIAVRSALNLQSCAVDLDMEPVFLEKRMELDAKFVGRTSVAMIASGFLAIALTFPYWHVHKFRKSIETK